MVSLKRIPKIDKNMNYIDKGMNTPYMNMWVFDVWTNS